MGDGACDRTNQGARGTDSRAHRGCSGNDGVDQATAAGSPADTASAGLRGLGLDEGGAVGRGGDSGGMGGTGQGGSAGSDDQGDDSAGGVVGTGGRGAAGVVGTGGAEAPGVYGHGGAGAGCGVIGYGGDPATSGLAGAGVAGVANGTSLPTLADATAVGVIGASDAGPGVVGHSRDGQGVIGRSRYHCGGVFSSDQGHHGQLNLVPSQQATLPKVGQPGDLYAHQRRPETGHATVSLYLCVAEGPPSLWQRVLLDPQHLPGGGHVPTCHT